MKSRPILFSGPMVRAIIDGRKSMTRRVLKRNKYGGWPYYLDGQLVGEQCSPTLSATPYRTGDLLWVRETWAQYPIELNPQPEDVWFKADGRAPPSFRWRPGIHMPRWASRLTLPVTGVKVERLQDISEEDAKAEGAPCCVMDDDGKFYERPEGSGTYRCGFAGLWTSINGRREGASWDDNPWVVVISFDAIRANVDEVMAKQREAAE